MPAIVAHIAQGIKKMNQSDRCAWCGTDPLYVEYHDSEWGVPCADDQRLFEFLVLESAQAGLSWLTILRKRDHYRKAYDNFDPETVARYTQRSTERLLKNPGIVRNKLKIQSSISNARQFVQIQHTYGSFAKYLWQFTDGRPLTNRFRAAHEIPASTPLSVKIARDLKQRGFHFFGPTICYAYMQATGMVNDHFVSCKCHSQCQRLGKSFQVPD